DANQEGADGALDPLPERHVVGLENHPLGAQQDGALDVVEEPTDVDVPPGRIAGEVRAPQTRMPRPGKARMTLIPCGFSRSCSLLVTCSSREMAPRTTSFAGALCTPRVSSL